MPAITDQNVAAANGRRRLARRLSWWAFVPLLLSWGWLPLAVWLEPPQPMTPPHSGSEVGAGIGVGVLLALEVVSGMIGTFVSSVLVIWAFLLKHRSVTLWIAAAINAIFWVGGVFVGWQVMPFLRYSHLHR
jgi:hypothetical protein